MTTIVRTAATLLFLIFFTLPVTAQNKAGAESDNSESVTTYLGQQAPGEKAEMFAPEVLTMEPHDSPIFSSDETWLVIGMMGEGKRFYKMTNGQLAPSANPLGFDIPEICNGMAASPSWDRVYFLEWKDGGERLCYVAQQEDHWTGLKPLEGGVDTYSRTWQFTVATNQNLYFSSDRIVVSVYDGNAHLEPVALKLEDGSDMLGTSPYIAPDESYVIYSVDWNLHISYNLNDGTWTKPINLGPNINSEQYDHCPKITPNGKYLFFTSRRNGPDWVTYWADASFVGELRPEGLN